MFINATKILTVPNKENLNWLLGSITIPVTPSFLICEQAAFGANSVLAQLIMMPLKSMSMTLVLRKTSGGLSNIPASALPTMLSMAGLSRFTDIAVPWGIQFTVTSTACNNSLG